MDEVAAQLGRLDAPGRAEPALDLVLADLVRLHPARVVGSQIAASSAHDHAIAAAGGDRILAVTASLSSG